MRRSYKILSFLLSIALFLSNVSLPAYAVENMDNTVSANDTITVSENEVALGATQEEQMSSTDSEIVILETQEEMAEETVQNNNVPQAVPSYSEIVINPAYEGLLDREAVEQELLSSTAEIGTYAVAASDTILTTVDEVVDYVREQMVVRNETITTVIPYSLYQSVTEFSSTIFHEAIEHTEECSGQEGDALYWAWKGYKFSGGGYTDAFTVTWTLTYYTTAAQEEELTEKVDAIMDEFAFTESTSDHEKIRTIHDYICDTVDYDDSLTKYSAYEALCTGTAVCQGYAVACYRLCKESDIPVRLIAGTGGGGRHGWNIVKIGDVYYNIDCTWDGQGTVTNDTWFLLNELDFVNHTRFEEYATDEFYQTYPMAEYSYGKETLEVYNQDNFSYSFTTLDEQTISSSANGKPKLLIFFNSGCYNSKSTISSLAEYDLDGVDIYALDAYKNEKATVQEFKETYGSENIVFSYSTATANSSPMWDYVRVMEPGATSTTFPVIAYIDANNKLQYVTKGISNAKKISSLLKQACGYTESFRKYAITYNLDGGNNHADNPDSFTAHTDTITLMDPDKTGYAFKGWYSDAQYTTQVTEIAKGTKKNITLYAKFVKELDLTVPSKTTYIVGEAIDLTGGSVTYNVTGQSTALTNSMISGFSTEEEGVRTVTVTYQGCSVTFRVLVVSMPQLTADYGQTLTEITLPESEYGIYSWQDETISLDSVGECVYTAIFTPKDTGAFGVRSDLSIPVKVYRSVKDGGLSTKIIGPTGWVYNGTSHQPKVEAYMDGELLAAKDYEVRYSENINAGWGYYWIDGKNYYKDSKGYSFSISKADLTITAEDVNLKLGDEMPQEWEYTVTGLVGNDTLVKEPSIQVTAADTLTTGIYEIIPSLAEATENYNADISYVNGILQIAEELVGFTVSFEMQGHGIAPQAYFGVKAGGAIERPQDPTAEGYAFGGWYKDLACTKEWNFETDTVQADTILYAKWNVVKENVSFCVSEILDVTYTGKELKPAVKVYDGNTLLKKNKDYKITYHNNINVNSNRAGTEFDPELPYAEIVGMGNYTDTIMINFHILPAVIGDGSNEPADGVSLSYSDQLAVNQKKDVSPFKSIKLGRTLKKNVDFTVSLTPIKAVNGSGEALSDEIIANGTIPRGSSGTFELTITGIGNYTGSINKMISVKDKKYLIKNATITLGKNLKAIDFDYYQSKLNGELTPAYYDKVTKKYYAVKNGLVDYSTFVSAKDVFVVKYGNDSLIYQKDYTVTYQNDDKAGKATLTIQGMGDYLGTKSVTYTLTGRAFNAKTVSVEPIAPQTYTGKPITLNDVELTYKDGTSLTYGKDYTISYAKHINKGKAVMTFTAKGDSGYQGSFKKNFTIHAAPIQDVIVDESMQDISVEYDRAGAKPADRVILKNAEGIALVSGKDYTLSYEYNKAVADKTASNAPAIVIKGIGNYGGDPLRIPFTITKASLNSDKISVTVKETKYNAKKVDTYQYKPVVKVMDGKKTLRINKDYEVEYLYNSQADYEAYYMQDSSLGEEYQPRVVIRTLDDSSYVLDTDIKIALPIYTTKLAKANLHVVVSTEEYTGTQVTPKVTVYYSSNANNVKNAKNLTEEEAILNCGLEKLTEDEDYTLSYGKNITAGKNKGTVTIQGKSPSFGGNVTVKFNIDSKKLIW